MRAAGLHLAATTSINTVLDDSSDDDGGPLQGGEEVGDETLLALGKALRGLHDAIAQERADGDARRRVGFGVVGIAIDGTRCLT